METNTSILAHRCWPEDVHGNVGFDASCYLPWIRPLWNVSCCSSSNSPGAYHPKHLAFGDWQDELLHAYWWPTESRRKPHSNHRRPCSFRQHLPTRYQHDLSLLQQLPYVSGVGRSMDEIHVDIQADGVGEGRKSHLVPNRKTLRVSSHVDMQRTSYMLSLPWTYAAPMMLAFTILHTFVARSVFLVRTSAYTAGSLEDSRRVMLRDTSRVGYSCKGILISTILGLILLIGLVANSFRSYRGVPQFFPRLANKTAFIKATCQRPQGDEDAHLFPVALMAVDVVTATRDGKSSTVRRLALSTDR